MEATGKKVMATPVNFTISIPVAGHQRGQTSRERKAGHRSYKLREIECMGQGTGNRVQGTGYRELVDAARQ
jgi:hypothetical protein